MSSFVQEQGALFFIKKELAEFLKNFISLEKEEIIHLLEQPRQSEHGHLALPLFSLAKTKKLPPQKIAQDFSAKINQKLPGFLKSCSSLTGFVNFQFQEDYLQKYLENLISKTPLACWTNNQTEHWLMDFASPNVAKHMNIGHLRATVLGQALVNITRAFGVKITSLNHLGDWGSQFGKLLWAYKKWGKEYDFKTKAFESLVALYVRFHKTAESDENNLQSARELFQKLEGGDEELKKLWERFVQLSLKNYDKYFKILNIKHDLILGESFYISFLENLKHRLKEKNLLEKSEGAEVVFLEKEHPPCLIFKRDGASTYSARDLTSLIYRFEELKADKNIYITGSDQALHFRQLFQVAGKINPHWKDKNLYLSFGMYRFKGEGKMSSRQGQAVYLKDVLEEAIARVEKIITERNPDLKDKKEIAREVGIGALIFNDLMNDRVKDVDFEWSKVLDFEGRSGPFVQYSLVRARSLLRKVDEKIKKQFSLPFEQEEEQILAWRLICFEEAVFQSFKKFKPHILARYLLDLAKEFNRFYTGQKVVGHKRELDLALLTYITSLTLDRGLEILNVPRPKAM